MEERPQVGYTGVNLRTSRTNTKDDHAARAINVDFNRELGTASIRFGRTQQADLSDNIVRLIAKVNSFRYYAAGNTPYRDGSSIAAGMFPAQLFGDTLPAGLTDIEGFRPLNDTTIWAFIADLGNRAALAAVPPATVRGRGHSAMVKDNGTTTYKWGIAPPPLAPVRPDLMIGDPDVTNLSNGTYSWFITHIRFLTSDFTTVAHEGNPIKSTATAADTENPTLAALTQSTEFSDI